MARAKRSTQKKRARKAKVKPRRAGRRGRVAGGARARAAAGDVRIRMYRTGLGDCFLLSFPRSGTRPFQVLVDCGVFFQTSNEKQRMVDVAGDIAAATRAGTTSHIDVLVATHEHYDHLVGFKHARPVFEGISIHEVWMAWPDEPGHPKARWMRRIEDGLRRGLRLALADAEADPALAGRANRLKSLLEFDGDALAADYSQQLGAVKKWLREETGAKVRYLEPHGKPIDLGDVPNARVYVMGPPLDEKYLRKMNDSKTDPETYSRSFAVSAGSIPAFARLGAERRSQEVGASRPAADELKEQQSVAMPFEDHWYVAEDKAATDLRTRDVLKHYGTEKGDALEWRRISNDWLTAAESLALQLDNLTNNSSLALAIEVGNARRVILLVADAQVGNWLSWHEKPWTIERPDGTRQSVQADELLARTVLYKVGHHGSHNATLKQRGLELMNSDELVAMIPVDEKFAREKKGWEMPFGPLLDEIKQRTRGRVIRVDHGLPSQSAVAAEVRGDFFARASETPLYVEYSVPMD